MKTNVFKKTLLAAFLVSVMTGGHAHAGGIGPWSAGGSSIDSDPGNGPTHIYMNQKAASTQSCNYKGILQTMHKYECTSYFQLRSHGVTGADGAYRTCLFSGSNRDIHELNVSENPEYCSIDTDGHSNNNTFYAIVNLQRSLK